MMEERCTFEVTDPRPPPTQDDQVPLVVGRFTSGGEEVDASISNVIASVRVMEHNILYIACVCAITVAQPIQSLNI